jgi:hypothetical protein
VVIRDDTAFVVKPVNAAVRPNDAEFDLKIGAFALSIRESGLHRINIFVVNELEESSGSRGRAAWRQSKQVLHAFVPIHLIALQVPVKRTGSGSVQRRAQPFLGTVSSARYGAASAVLAADLLVLLDFVPLHLEAGRQTAGKPPSSDLLFRVQCNAALRLPT